MSVCTCAYSSTISSSLLNEYFQPLILIKLGFATKAKKIYFKGLAEFLHWNGNHWEI